MYFSLPTWNSWEVLAELLLWFNLQGTYDPNTSQAWKETSDFGWGNKKK